MGSEGRRVVKDVCQVLTSQDVVLRIRRKTMGRWQINEQAPAKSRHEMMKGWTGLEVAGMERNGWILKFGVKLTLKTLKVKRVFLKKVKRETFCGSFPNILNGVEMLAAHTDPRLQTPFPRFSCS